MAFRVDATPAIGGGHVMRCLSLATALAEVGADCRFHCAPGSAETVPALAASGHEVAGPDLGAEADWLVVDHYGLDAEYETGARRLAERVLVIDDLANRPHDCDLLLDQTPGRDASAYDGFVPEGCAVLAGPDFALLRPAFAARRDAALARHCESEGVAQKLLIACGSSDPANLTSRALDAAEDLDLETTAVLGAAAPHLESVRARCGRLLVEPEDMAGLMVDADIAIGAGGTSSLERCCLGLPSLIAVIADNQTDNAAALAARGAACDLGPASDLTRENLAKQLAELAGDDRARGAMARAAATLCDGLGARRVAMQMLPERARDGRAVVLRKAQAGDSATMLTWQQHPDVRRWARNPTPPSPEEHDAWMAAKLDDPGCLLNVIERDGESVGVLRLDRLDNDGPRYEVSILIAPKHQGGGLAQAALALARRLVPEAALVAEVKPENAASHALFRSAGYRPTETGYIL